MKCPNCDATLKNNPKFCPYCGSDLREMKEDKKEVVSHEIEAKPQKKKVETKTGQRKIEPQPAKKKVEVKWALLTIIPLAIAIVIFLFFNNKNAAYVTAMENGIEAASSEEYDTALTYFDEALIEKKNDDRAKKWSHSTANLQDANKLYLNDEFEQALIKINDVLDADSSVNDITILVEKAAKLKTKIEKIIVNQDVFDLELQEAQTMFDNVAADEKEVQNIIKKLEAILAREEIHEEYYADVRKIVETLIVDVKAYEEKVVEGKAMATEKEKTKALEEKTEALEKKSQEAIKQELSEYTAKEIEYARIILMDGYPNGSTIYISESPAGRAIASPYDETIKYPEATVTLTGSYGADGMTVYSPIGGGYITVYPVPMRWHQDDQSPEGYRAYTQQILDDAQRVYIDPGDPVELLEKLRTTEFIQSN